MMRAIGVTLALGWLSLPAVVGLTAGAELGLRCEQVAASADEGGVPAGWEYERVDDEVGQWYSPGDVLQGWAVEEDGAVWSSRVCAVRDGAR